MIYVKEGDRETKKKDRVRERERERERGKNERERDIEKKRERERESERTGELNVFILGFTRSGFCASCLRPRTRLSGQGQQKRGLGRVRLSIPGFS